MDDKFQRVSHRDPNCCRASIPTGQCSYKAVKGSQHCPLHGGSIKAAADNRAQLRNILLQGALAQRASELAGSTHLKDLTDEVALSRLTLEQVLKKCQTENDFLLYSDKINTTIKTVQSLVESLQKIQEKNKELIDRPTLMKIVDLILAVIVQYVNDPDDQKACGEAIYGCIVTGFGEQISR